MNNKGNNQKKDKVHNSSDLLNLMTEEDIKNLQHHNHGQSGYGDEVAGYCMWCGGEFTNLAVSHKVVRFNKNVGSCYKCFVENKNKNHRTIEEQVKFMWDNWQEFKKISQRK